MPISDYVNFANYFYKKHKWTKRFKWRPPLKPFVRWVKDPSSGTMIQTTKFKQKSDIGRDEKKDLMTNIQMFEKYNKPFVGEVIQRRRKNIACYRLVKQYTQIHKQCKVVKLKEWKSEMKIEAPNKIVGITPDHIGFRPGKRIKSETNILRKGIFPYADIPKIQKKFPNVNEALTNASINYKTAFSGSPDTNMGHLRNFFKSNKQRKYKLPDLLHICLHSDWFNFNSVDFKDPDEMMYCVNYNPHSDPGHYFKVFTKNHKKRETIFGAVHMAQQLFKDIKKLPTRNYCLWDLLSREKDIKVDDDYNNPDKEVSTRVVLNPEHHVTVLLGWIYQKWMAAQSLPPEKGYLDRRHFYIKGEFNGKKARSIIERFSKYDFISTPDFRLFDSSQDSDYIIAAHILMFTACINNKFDKRLFYYITEAALTKYVAVPPGIVVELNRGNPSGSPGVTAINCVANMIRWAVVGFELYGPDYQNYMDLLVYGDDTYLGLTAHPNLSKIHDIMLDNNYEGDNPLDTLYPGEYLMSDNFYDAPDFLKRHVSIKGIYWNKEKVFSRMLYQTKKRSPTEQVNLLRNYPITAPCDHEFNEFCHNVYEILKNTYNIKATDNEDLRKLDYFKYLPYGYFDDPLGTFKLEVSYAQSSKEIYLPHHGINASSIDWDLYKAIYVLTHEPKYLNTLKNFQLFNFNTRLLKYQPFKQFRILTFEDSYIRFKRFLK